VQLDPLARVSQLNLGESYAGSGDNRKALDIWLECARTNPDWSDAPDYISRHLVGLGRIDEALAWATKTTSLTPDRVQAGFDSGLRFPG
jgi:tetratricopeptide (TPR) repeat protein